MSSKRCSLVTFGRKRILQAPPSPQFSFLMYPRQVIDPLFDRLVESGPAVCESKPLPNLCRCHLNAYPLAVRPDQLQQWQYFSSWTGNHGGENLAPEPQKNRASHVEIRN